MSRRLLVAVLAGGALALPPAASTAVDDRTSSSARVTGAPGGPRALLVPGSSTTTELKLHNGRPGPVQLRMRMTNVINSENQCLRPEVITGDTTCGPASGELSRWLEVEVRSHPRRNAPLLSWTGPFEALRAPEGVVLGSMPAGNTTVLLETTLVSAAPNETMTDSISYDLDWALDQPNRSVPSGVSRTR